MFSSLSTKRPAAPFLCECGDSARSACEGLPFYKESEGKKYCVLHYPGRDKCTAFNEALERKLTAKDFNFGGVCFPDVVDLGVEFTTAAYFGGAVFHAEARFFLATFNEEAHFGGATFYAGAYFDSATFCKEANFGGATFKDCVRFSTGLLRVFEGNSSLNLRFAVIEKPERFSFCEVTLHPHWFVSVDARKFEFTNVNWDWAKTDTQTELVQVGKAIGSNPFRDEYAWSPYSLLAIASRNLAVNAEENHRYEEASRFRYMAIEARRLEKWHGFAFWTLGWWYWLASGYSERAWRAFVVLIGVWLVAAALYTQVGFVRWEPRVSSETEAAEARRDEVGRPLLWPRALTYSLGVMTLQKPEPRPATDAAQAVVMIETILGPVQAALLALAIRRKFMR